MIISVNVLQENIDAGEPCNPYACAIAIAVRSALGATDRIEISDTTIAVTVDGEKKFFITPWIVTQFIHAYDSGKPVQPFEFRIKASK